MDENKIRALLEFAHLVAKEDGYTGDIATDILTASNVYIIPMISVL